MTEIERRFTDEELFHSVALEKFNSLRQDLLTRIEPDSFNGSIPILYDEVPIVRWPEEKFPFLDLPVSTFKIIGFVSLSDPKIKEISLTCAIDAGREHLFDVITLPSVHGSIITTEKNFNERQTRFYSKTKLRLIHEDEAVELGESRTRILKRVINQIEPSSIDMSGFAQSSSS